VPAQLTFLSGDVNVWWDDGNGTTFGTNPYLPQETIAGAGTALSAGGLVWLNAATATTPPGPQFAPYTYNSFASSAFGSAVVNWDPATLVSGGTNFGTGSFAGTSITLVNNSLNVAEVRLDWAASYNNGGPAFTLPVSIYGNFAGSYATGGFAAIAGQLSFTDTSVFATGTANIPICPFTICSGDWHDTTGYPGGLNANGAFFGYKNATSSPYNAYVGAFAPGIAVGAGDNVTVTGYLDVLVDPGTVQLVLQSGPYLGITIVNSHPVVNWPAALTNFVLESRADLVSGDWVTNTSPITTSNGTNSITVNPATGKTFYRLKQ